MRLEIELIAQFAAEMIDTNEKKGVWF